MNNDKIEKREAKLLFHIVREKYGNYLNVDELNEVFCEVKSLVEAAEALRSVKLEYWDEPSSIFLPYRSDIVR